MQRRRWGKIDGGVTGQSTTSVWQVAKIRQCRGLSYHIITTVKNSQTYRR